MKASELLAVGVRLCGVMLVVVGLKSIARHYQTFSMMNFNGDIDTTWLAYIAVGELLIVFLLSVLFIKFPMTFAKKLLPVDELLTVDFSDGAESFMSVCFCVLGVYILSWAIPDLVDNGMWLWYFSGERHYQSPSYSEVIITTTVTVVEILIGLFLCLRARGFSNLLWRLRGAS